VQAKITLNPGLLELIFMKSLFNIAVLASSLFLAACGGGTDTAEQTKAFASLGQTAATEPAPIAKCNGTPKVAVVYVGQAVDFPDLAALPNACVYTTQAATVAEFAAVMEQARNASGVMRPYIISYGTLLPLAYRDAFPGISEVTSMWNVPATQQVPEQHGSIVSVYLNGGDGCESIAAAIVAQHTPSVCSMAAVTDWQAAAIAQLQLPQ
jgi:hypothetical protein